MKIRRNIIGMILVCTIFAGCASNPMVAIYDNNERIASNTNTFNLDAVEQEITDGQNRIKLVADKDTKFDIEVSITEGDFSRIGF